MSNTKEKKDVQLKSALERAEKMYQTIFDIARDIISITSVEGLTLSLNSAYEDITGCSISSLIGKPYISVVHPDDATRMAGVFEQALQTQNVPMFYCRIAKKGGDWVELENWTVPWFEDGKLTAFLSFSRDITERKRMDEIKASKLSAEAANKAKSVFVANVSHEIRTPLGLILGFAELGAENCEDQFLKEYFSKIKNNADHLMLVINEILDLSKIESGKTEVSFSNYDLKEVVENTIYSMKDAIEKKGLQFVFKIHDDAALRLYGDEKRLRQIMTNILGNALKFTEKGQIKLELKVIEKNSQGKPTFLGIDISDTGIGIDSKDAEKLFIPFNQIDSAITRRFGGTGIGLALSLQFARAMGGDIELLKSVPGAGSTFRIKLKV